MRTLPEKVNESSLKVISEGIKRPEEIDEMHTLAELNVAIYRLGHDSLYRAIHEIEWDDRIKSALFSGVRAYEILGALSDDASGFTGSVDDFELQKREVEKIFELRSVSSDEVVDRLYRGGEILSTRELLAQSIKDIASTDRQDTSHELQSYAVMGAGVMYMLERAIQQDQTDIEFRRLIENV